jgi:hypothetical protein
VNISLRHLGILKLSVKSLLNVAIVAVTLVSTSYQRAESAIVASDDASQPAYSNGWQAGDNGGTGFGAWTFAYSGNNTNGLLYSPQFIDTAPPLPANTLGAPSFALTTNQTDTSEVRRTFVVPLAIGQTFSADLNGSALNPSAPAYTIGNTFELLGTNGIERFGLLTNNEYHGGRWTVTGDVDTGIAAGNGFHIDFTLVTANAYDLVLSPVGGGVPYLTQTGAPLAGTAGVAINRLRVSNYGTGSSSDGSKELFFDNLVISEPDGIPGDYNEDNTVDAADYVVWRKQHLDTAAYALWRTHFGETASSNEAATLKPLFAVPEPSGHWIAFLVIIGAWCRLHRQTRS